MTAGTAASVLCSRRSRGSQLSRRVRRNRPNAGNNICRQHTAAASIFTCRLTGDIHLIASAGNTPTKFPVQRGRGFVAQVPLFGPAALQRLFAESVAGASAACRDVPLERLVVEAPQRGVSTSRAAVRSAGPALRTCGSSTSFRERCPSNAASPATAPPRGIPEVIGDRTQHLTSGSTNFREFTGVAALSERL